MRIAIVTGASSGMGKEFARWIPECYRTLDEIWISGRNKDRLEGLREELEGNRGIKVKIFDRDLMESAFYDTLKTSLEEETPDVRMLVNAAGFGKIGKIEDLDIDAQADMIDVNCRALTKVTLLCLPFMSKGSRIINLASAAAFSPQPGFSVYAATKAYVHSFSRALGEEVRKKGILVTSVCPGPVDTAFFEVAGTANSFAKQAVMAKPQDVVKRALKDSIKGKEVSVYGKTMKLAKVACKILPHKLIMRIMGGLADR